MQTSRVTPPPDEYSAGALRAAGRRARDVVPRATHAEWSPAPDRPR